MPSLELNFKADFFSLKHEESLAKAHFTSSELQGLLQQHECEGKKNWTSNQLAQVIHHLGSLEERYSSFLFVI